MVYKWYILPIGGLYATYHLLGEPETTIENGRPSLKLTASSPLRIGPKLPQKEINHRLQPPIFECKLAVSFREGNSSPT